MYLHASIITNSLSTKLSRYRIKESIQSTLKVSKKMIHPQIRMRPILSLIWFTKIQRQQKTFGRYLCKTLFSLDFEQKLKKWTNLLGGKNGNIRIRKRPTSVQPIGTLKV